MILFSNTNKSRLRSSFFLLSGLIIVIIVSSLALLAPIIAPYPPDLVHLDNILSPPSSTYFFGTDRLGRDVFSRLLFGGRISLCVGFIAVCISIIIGSIIGIISGYFSGGIDHFFMRLVDVMLCFPTFFLILTVIAFLEPNLINIMIIIGLTSWMGCARLVRADTLSIRERDFIATAKLSGSSTSYVILKHFLPNVTGSILITGSLGIAGAILIESSLSFLGLGVQPPKASWGNMLMDGKSVIEVAPWLTIYPGIAILITVIGYNLLGEGLRAIFDPYVRK